MESTLKKNKIDAVSHEPNEVTIAAMKEAKSGLVDQPTLDMSSIEAMERSMGL